LRFIRWVLRDRTPENPRSESSGTKSASPLSTVKGTTPWRLCREALPRAAEVLESVHGLILRHSVAVVLNPDLDDAA
jgi:hypothetical protein